METGYTASAADEDPMVFKGLVLQAPDDALQASGCGC